MPVGASAEARSLIDIYWKRRRKCQNVLTVFYFPEIQDMTLAKKFAILHKLQHEN